MAAWWPRQIQIYCTVDEWPLMFDDFSVAESGKWLLVRSSFTDILLFFLLVRMQLQWHCTRLVLAELTVLTEAEWAT